MLVGDKGGIYGLDWLTRPRYISPPPLGCHYFRLLLKSVEVKLCHVMDGEIQEGRRKKEKNDVTFAPPG